MTDVAIVQKDEIRIVRSAQPSLARKSDVAITLLPDCVRCRERATVAGN